MLPIVCGRLVTYKANEPLISDTKRKVVSIMRRAVKAHITNTEQEMMKRFNELCDIERESTNEIKNEMAG